MRHSLTSILLPTGLLVLVVLLAILYARKTRRDVCTTPLQRIPTHDGTVLIVEDACKEGMPHTTDADTIIFPISAWENPRRATTLHHERIHLAQKRAPEEWYAFYKTAWEYTVHPTCPAGVPAALVAALRPNPDTADTPFAVWKSRYVFFPIYQNSAAPTLRDARIIVWDLKQGRALKEPPAEWRAEFCDGGDDACPNQYEHPHEIAAVFLADGSTSRAAAKLFAWRQ